MRPAPLLFAIALTASAVALEFDLSALKWRNIGPNRGGRSQAIAGSVKRPLEYYFGATGGGLWKTTNSGLTWAPVTDGQLGSSSVGAVAVAESNPDVVYLGMGETELRASIMQGDGVYKSTDAGKTWKHVGLVDTQAISRIRVDPSNPDIVYVAALGHPYGPNPERGIFRSTDGGQNWKRILFRDERAGAADLVLDPHNPKVLFASLWQVQRTPWNLSSGGESSGFFKSTDGGDTWMEITRAPGLPKGIIGKITVAVSPADSNRVYAMVEAAEGGLFRSDDAGQTWTLINEDHAIRQRAFYFSRITADPQKRDTLWIMNVEIYRSDDGGKTLQRQRTAHADHHDLWIAPNDSRRMAASDDGGGCISVDGGKTWSRENFPTAQFYHVATTAELPYDVVGAQQDAGTAAVPTDRAAYRHEPGLPAGEWMYPVAGGEAGYIAPDPKNPDITFGGDQAGIVVRFDRRTGASRAVNVYPLFFSGMSAGVLRDRWQWTFPIVFSPVATNTLYTSSQRLFKSTSEGQHWEPISGDLTRGDPATLGDSGGPITKDQNGPEIYGTIFSVAPSRKEADTIWTGSDDGLVYLTRDGGKHWTNVTPPTLPANSRISLIEASPHDAGAAFVAAKRYQMDDRTPYLFKTHDYGKTWTAIVSGIKAGDYLQAVREDPRRAGLLYAGTEHGVYFSYDDGSHWRSLALNLPDTQVADLVVERNDLVIATHGRSFWILDDIAPLRQYAPEVVAAPAHLFEPPPVVRSVTPARIDYYLAHSADKVTLEVLDAKSQVIRMIDSKENEALKTEAGLNRYVWDTRYPGAVTFPGVVLRGAAPGQGPKAPPGTYTLRLNANGVTVTRSLVIQRDPRLTDVTDADLTAEFDLAIRLRDELGLAHATVLKIKSLREQVEERVKANKDPAITAPAEAFLAKLTAVEEDLYQTKNRSPRDTFNYPIKLNNQLAVLGSLVDRGDGKPPDQDYAVHDELKGNLDGIVARFDAAVGIDLPTLNQTLKSRELAAVKVPEGIKLISTKEAAAGDPDGDDDDDDDSTLN